MAHAWNHSTLGSFKFDLMQGGWWKIITAPGFNAFEWDTGFSDCRAPNGKYKLTFESRDENDIPAAELVAVSQKLVADQSYVVSLITGALWEDFCGRGPNSGMWWHGRLDKVQEYASCHYLKKMPPLIGSEGLLSVMRLTRISIQTARGGTGTNPFTGDLVKIKPRPPLAEIAFRALFEDEHGVGVLTDGVSVFGTGYGIDVGLFKSE